MSVSTYNEEVNLLFIHARLGDLMPKTSGVAHLLSAPSNLSDQITQVMPSIRYVDGGQD